MNFSNNNRSIFWILIFLVLVNISVLAGYFIVFRNAVNKSIPEIASKPGGALKEKLSLTPDQTVKVQEINSVYKSESEPIILSIREKKAELLEELSKENTDTNTVSTLTEEVMMEQTKLQKANIHQFLDLKKVCTPEQTKKLSQIYSELYGYSDAGKGNGKGKGNGMGRRYRWGQQRQADSAQKVK